MWLLSVGPASDSLDRVRYAITIFASACLLFQIQPMIGKMILPWFGGSAAVWTASLLFFQLALLAGYAYAHASLRWLRPRAQIAVHCGLLIASCLVLPIGPAASWRPTEPGDPTLRILALLGATIGPPYVVLASTTPLVQAWFTRRTGAVLPYRLFALSNFGSLVALIGYPTLVEPFLAVPQQAAVWSVGYLGFVVACGLSALASTRAGAPTIEAPVTRPRASQIALWVMLAACPSALLVAITNHISQNIAAIPLLWVVPLALYLASFIAVFESDRVYRRRLFIPIMAISLFVMARLLYPHDGKLDFRWAIPGYAIGLFACCMVCHGELARRRPAAGDSSVFYLALAFGGALGGGFVAVIAPRVFDTYSELPLALVTCGVLATIALWTVPRTRIPLAGGTMLLACYLIGAELDQAAYFTFRGRNFYGLTQVQDDPPNTRNPKRSLVNGMISHGTQLLDPARRCMPTSYFGESSGIGRAIGVLQARGPISFGILGLGAGVLASYGRPGDHTHVFEINPLDEEVARAYFTFLGCPGDTTVSLGDGRLALETLPPQHYDLLAIDAFAGDSIPMHLLTREAFAVYFRHLTPNGVLALQISNDFVGLEPICARAAALFGKRAILVYDRGSRATSTWPTKWVLVTSDPTFVIDAAQSLVSDGGRAWTDDYSNMLEVLKLP